MAKLIDFLSRYGSFLKTEHLVDVSGRALVKKHRTCHEHCGFSIHRFWEQFRTKYNNNLSLTRIKHKLKELGKSFVLVPSDKENNDVAIHFWVSLFVILCLVSRITALLKKNNFYNKTTNFRDYWTLSQYLMTTIKILYIKYNSTCRALTKKEYFLSIFV